MLVKYFIFYMAGLLLIHQNGWGSQDPYNEDTLRISVPASEIEQTPIWKQHGVVYDRFLGVPAYANRRNGEYQCTELVHRFLNVTYGIPTRIGIGLGHANILAENIFERFSNQNYNYESQEVEMQLHANNTADEPPANGSVVNFAIGDMGHIAVVRYVEILSATQAKIYLIEQHGFPSWAVNEPHPIRHVIFIKNQNGWGAPRTPGIGTPIHWINFKTIDSE